MSIPCFYELDWRSRDNLEVDFGKDYKDIISTLGARGLYKEDKNGYKLEYVGIISYKDKIIPVLPKFLKKSNLINTKELDVLKTTIDVLKKYDSISHDDFHSSSGISRNFLNSKLALIDSLIKDFIEYGLYESHIETYEISGDGEIDWENTIENEQAYLIKGNPIYLDLWTSETVSNDGNYIRRLHEYILNTCIEYLSNLEIQKSLNLINVPNIDFPVNKDILGDVDYMIAMIEKQLKNEFGDRNLSLLELMKKFLKDDFKVNSNEVNLWGTGTFHVIWEMMCKNLFKDEYNTYKNQIPYPSWNSWYPSKENRASHTSIPDTLRQIDENFFIFDAKYYNFYFDNLGNLKGGYPGIGDITKQFAYEMAFESNFKNIYNFFVIPTVQETKVIGDVSLNTFKNLKSIKILSLNYSQVFEMYINDSYYSNSFFYNIIKEPSY